MKLSSMEETCYDQNTSTQEYSYHEDEVLDTLSLSDLLIYDNNGDPQLDFYRVDDQNPNLDTDDHEFEFSSELLKTSVSSSVVFCGKIIPYKEPGVSENTHKQDQRKKQHKRRYWRLVPFFKKSRNLDSSEKLDLKYEVPIRRVSILASATKPRWYLFMFGFGSSRFPVKMHIRDLKKRQTSMGTRSGGGNKISDGTGGCGRGDDGSGSAAGIGSWSLARLLGCGGGGGHHHPKAIVKIQ